MMPSVRLRALVASAVVVVSLATACRDEPGVGGAGGGVAGQGGAGGCPTQPHAAFQLGITADQGAVPADLRLVVTWSVGKQAFDLADVSTWRSLVDGNVICDVDADAGSPTARSKLTCELWTTGPTQVALTAKGYAELDRTLTPKLTGACDLPPTEDVALVLRRPQPDAGEE
jgi:hypothetical protein